MPSMNYNIVKPLFFYLALILPGMINAQTSEPAYLTLSQNSLQLNSLGNSQTVTVSSNQSWIVDSTVPWLGIAPLEGSGDQVITILGANNDTGASRNGLVIISAPDANLSQQVTITQSSEDTQPVSSGSTDDNSLNWTQVRTYDENGSVIGASRAYFDLKGEALQTQSLNVSENRVLASQVIDDALGRPVLSTLEAPLGQPEFGYKADFVQDEQGNPYHYSHFDDERKTNPLSIGNSEPGTLGWYYSDNNTDEHFVAATAYPYNRTEFYDDGTGRIQRSAGVGEAHRLGAGHESYTHTFPLHQELDGHYRQVRNTHVFSDQEAISSYANCGVKTVSIDPNGRQVVVFNDNDGNLLASAVPNGDNPQTVSVSLDIPLPTIYFANVQGNVSQLDSRTRITFRINGNQRIQIYDITAGLGTSALLYDDVVSSDILELPLPDGISSFHLQLRSKSDFSYQVEQDDNSWVAMGDVQSSPQDRVEGHEFYLPAGGDTNISLTRFGAEDIPAPSLRIENILDGTASIDEVIGSMNISRPPGFYRATLFHQYDDLSVYPLAMSYSGGVRLQYSYALGDWSYNFYDESDRVVSAITPNGVQQLHTGVPYHEIAKSTYQYNYQGWLLASTEKDAGRTEYMYRKDGAIRFSQNARQRAEGTFSYSNYDASGRPVESGEYDPSGTSLTFGSAALENILEARGLSSGLGSVTQRSDWNRTYYDLPDPEFNDLTGLTGYTQEFVMGGVSYTENEHIKTWYSYDDQGRITWLAQYIEELDRTFTVDYGYDFLGNVIQIVYQRGIPQERFYHHYTYDEDQRLSEVFISRDGTQQTLQATYQYYLHGPLKRVELGEGLQGMDYVYTPQGWLKAINNLEVATDPGEDGSNGFHPDAFGMTLDYFGDDYSRAGSDVVSSNGDSYGENYGGNIGLMNWVNVLPDNLAQLTPVSYSFNYDEDYQLAQATWGRINESGSFSSLISNYAVRNLDYDPNGNLLNLERYDNNGALNHDFTYQYEPNTNKLTNIPGYSAYAYNEIGELTTQTPLQGPARHMAYDVTGKLTGVYADEDHSQPQVLFAYDDRGFRLKKEVYKNGSRQHATWYIRDVGGMLLASYDDLNEDGSTATPLSLKELPVYGSGKLGIYYPERQNTYFEVKDHLGNVRAIVASPDEDFVYEATMEDAVIAEESGYYDFPAGVVQPLGNQRVARLNHEQRIGPNITLNVMPGDQVTLQADGAYFTNAGTNNQAVGEIILASALSAFMGNPVSPGSEFFQHVAWHPSYASFFSFWGDSDDDRPRGYINYLLFDSDLRFLDAGYSRVPEAGGSTGGLNFTQLSLELPEIERPGYLFIYTSNEGQGQSEVYFDNITVTHQPGIVRSATDYYPFGLEMEGRSFSALGPKGYRFGYQGDFAEKDEETGWNAFELRQYDAAIGRWTTRDPAGQYSSPYLAVGNNPMSRVDPDGGVDMRALPWEHVKFRSPIKATEFYASWQGKTEIEAPEIIFQQLGLPYIKGAKLVTTIRGWQATANYTSLSWNDGRIDFEATYNTDWLNPANSSYVNFTSGVLENNAIDIRFYAPTPLRGDFISGTRVLVTLFKREYGIVNGKVQGDFVHQQDYFGIGGRVVGETLPIRWGDGLFKFEANAGFRFDLQWPWEYTPNDE